MTPRIPVEQPDGSVVMPSFMRMTNGGGSLESVPGFVHQRAIADRFDKVRLPVPPGLGTESHPPVPHPAAALRAWLGTSPAALGSILPLLLQGPQPGAGLETVHGVDDRVKVPDTALIPWRCICHLQIIFENGSQGYGTGWLAGPHTVVTAAHCLCDPRTGLRAAEVRVTPGRDGGIGPYGQFVSEDFATAPGWPDDAAGACDIGAVSLQAHATGMFGDGVGERLGYFGFAHFPDARLDMLLVNNSGYPFEAAKPFATQWFNGGRIRGVERDHVTYMIDTEGGQSGSPVFFYDADADQRLVIAVHCVGYYPNRGVRITRAVFDMLRGWSENPPKGRLGARGRSRSRKG
ncbi:trypsin-like peptidase domain-containing protein [uncultured Paracoccus sp.]|uniref:trypsin-like serine peptidase n=1 Tax=uncultured Paracoccus sp. TaxID=189685 RepID=UPI0025F08189|nr:trypsin-like peptidase domain-containing protein [uncultured Paracoccus sp.]